MIYKEHLQFNNKNMNYVTYEEVNRHFPNKHTHERTLNTISHQVNETQKYNEILSTHEDGYDKKRQIITSVDEDEELQEPLYIATGDVK